MLPPGARSIRGFSAVKFPIKTGSVTYWPIYGFVLLPKIFSDVLLMIWLRSTVTEIAPSGEGFDTLCAVGFVNVFPAQLSRKKPCVLATEGSVPATILPPGPVPTPVPGGGVGPGPPPELFAGSFLHDSIIINAATMANAVLLMFFMF